MGLVYSRPETPETKIRDEDCLPSWYGIITCGNVFAPGARVFSNIEMIAKRMIWIVAPAAYQKAPDIPYCSKWKEEKKPRFKLSYFFSNLNLTELNLKFNFNLTYWTWTFFCVCFRARSVRVWYLAGDSRGLKKRSSPCPLWYYGGGSQAHGDFTSSVKGCVNVQLNK